MGEPPGIRNPSVGAGPQSVTAASRYASSSGHLDATRTRAGSGGWTIRKIMCTRRGPNMEGMTQNLIMWAWIVACAPIGLFPTLIHDEDSAIQATQSWWRGDVVQISILVAHFLLFAPIAYLLQRKPDDPEFEIINFHNCLLLLHIETAIAFASMGGMLSILKTRDPITGAISSMSPSDELVLVGTALLRLVAIWFTTAWTFLCCMVLSHSTDILFPEENDPIYWNISRTLMRPSGFGWFVWLVKPAPFPDANLPHASTGPATASKDIDLELLADKTATVAEVFDK
ncbi:hypothetical protein C8J57DRAFT_1220868 [Mycena rebaudengoi]|nr:hypothetical protein C8J57DRAFT_1220868 [Mycena rebaudengoi]